MAAVEVAAIMINHHYITEKLVALGAVLAR
jgi:hypothetical protein